MTSTTLMTFLLTTSSNVRSVKLLGSWDNFSKSYVMEKDSRVGSGQWRGCHTFTDIICDGAPDNMLPGRSGGLKMGGTYWYYYLLDDDVEYYNPAQPVTSHCPFLPGQPVNVLHVPIILPDSLPTHTREDSIASQRSDIRTMNPEDKFMNPRQPPKPKLTRLGTSIPLLQQPTPAWSFSTSPLSALTNRTASQPNSDACKSRGCDVRAGPSGKAARSMSPPRSRGLRAALRYLNTSASDLNPVRSRAGTPEASNTQAANYFNNRFGLIPPSSWSSETDDKETPQRPRPVSAGHYESGSGSLTIQDRRALKSKSRDSSPRRTPLTLEMRSGRNESGDETNAATVRSKRSEETSYHTSPSLLAPGNRSAGDPTTPTPFTAIEKRLPTLPNTPSSVMDEALRDIDEREKALDTEVLASHFSDFSITDESTGYDSRCETSHFSAWSTDTDAISPESMVSSSTFNFEFDSKENHGLEQSGLAADCSDPDTPHLTVNSQPSPASSVAGDSPRMNIPPPHLSVAFSPTGFDIPGLCIENVDEVETNPKRHAAFFGGMESYEALGLAKSPSASTIVFPEGIEEGKKESLAESSRRYSRFSDAQFAGQSATMQEMMDELSYLKNMIQSGASVI